VDENVADPADPLLYDALLRTIEAALLDAQSAFSDKKYASTKREWPKLTGTLDCGMPSFSFSLGLFDGPIDYSSLLPDIYTSETSFGWYRDFRDFCASHERVREFYQVSPDDQYKFLDVRVLILIGQFIDSYIHTFGTFEYDKEKATELYAQWESGLYSDSLKLMFVVPLLFLQCDFETVLLSDNAAIVKLEEKQQLSRMASSGLQYSASHVQRIVAGAATHAFVSAGWSLEKQTTYFELIMALSRPQSFPTDVIDDLFCALRVGTSAVTGYSQAVWAPVGWAADFKGDLLPWIPVLVRRYPTRFEDGYWVNKEVSRLDARGGETVRQVFNGLRSSNRKEHRVATRRINLAALREEEEDSILDATIALEALLSDDSAQEMTHKLALRLAALSRLVGYHHKPVDVFKGVKHVYSYRSQIVHGSTKAKDRREISVGQQPGIPAVAAAETYARLALRAVLEHPEFGDPQKIDSELLLGEAASGLNEAGGSPSLGTAESSDEEA